MTSGLAELDRAIERRSGGRPTTLDPARHRATSLVDLSAVAPGSLGETLTRGLESLAEAQLEHFPENLCWDLDFVVGTTLRSAASLTDPHEFIERRFADLVALEELYGIHTPIRFRYVHDLTYGYDWAKWLRRTPEASRDIGPCDEEFLRYMNRRGHELLTLIEADDAKYHRLRDDEPRNPFPFSREPDDELRLHRALARHDELPIQAWRLDSPSRWDRPYGEIRVERARVLGLLRNGRGSD